MEPTPQQRRDLENTLLIAQSLSKARWNGCKEDGDVDNCLTRGCPCCEQAARIVEFPDHGGG